MSLAVAPSPIRWRLFARPDDGLGVSGKVQQRLVLHRTEAASNEPKLEA
jgi:hypothetical protein